jgi:hypothetical protein
VKTKGIDFSASNGTIIRVNAVMNSATSVSWAITGCTLSETVDAQYCAERCNMCDCCKIGIVRKKEVKRRGEKVCFT